MCEGATIECSWAQYTLNRMIQFLCKLMLDVLSNKNRMMQLSFCGGRFLVLSTPILYST